MGARGTRGNGRPSDDSSCRPFTRLQFAAAQLRDRALAEGQPDEALAVYPRHYPALLEDREAVIDLRNYRAAIDLALVLRVRGEPAFEAVLQDIRKDVAAHMTQIRELERSGDIGAVPGVVFDGA
jgi:hypothetical protein